MSVRLAAIDEEIRALEARIADDRAALSGALSEVGDSVRETARSPTVLLAAAGVGFVAGRLLFRRGGHTAHAAAPPPAPSKLGGLLGLLAAGMSMMQPGSGTGGIARWAAQKLWESRSGRATRSRDRTPDVATARAGPRATSVASADSIDEPAVRVTRSRVEGVSNP